MFDNSVSVRLGHVTSRRVTETSERLEFLPFVSTVIPTGETTGGTFDSATSCPHCGARVHLRVNQQLMLHMPSAQLTESEGLRNRIASSYLRRRMPLLVIIWLMAITIVGWYTAFFLNLSEGEFVIGWVALVFLVAWGAWELGVKHSFAVLRRARQIRAGTADLLISPEELEVMSIAAPEWADLLPVIRDVTLGRDQTKHRIRDGDTGESTRQSGDTITTTTITGENLWRGFAEYFDEIDTRFIQIGGHRKGMPPKDPDAPRVGVDGNRDRLATLAYALGGALLACAAWCTVIALSREGIMGGKHLTGIVAETARDLGLGDTFTVMFLAGFPPTVAGWVAYRWRAFVPSFGRTEAVAIAAVGLLYSLAFWLFLSPWHNSSNAAEAGWAVFWALIWPVVNLASMGACVFIYFIVEEYSADP